MSQPPVPPSGLSASNLTVSKEGTYYTFVLILSILFWLLIAVSIIGIFYALLFGFFLWLGNGLLIALLRSEAVRVDERQLPELHRAFLEVCQNLGVTTPPKLYVLQANGALNAFATRFAGRDFVVVYSDFLEALGPASPEMKFVLGHELGHIKSGHILKQIFLAPGMFFPLIGPAYRRAWETSCDRYGAFAAQDVEGSVRAMLTVTGGRENGRRLDAEAFAGQHRDERGFFVSLHELTSTYPTLSRRVTDLLALRTGTPAQKPQRHPLAYLLGCFMPGGNMAGGGAAGAMLMIVIIGLLAAMAIPAFQKVRQSAQAKACANNQRQLEAAFDQYYLENNKGAETWDDVVGAEKYVPVMPICLIGGTYSANFDEETKGYVVECDKHGNHQNYAATTPDRAAPAREAGRTLPGLLLLTCVLLSGCATAGPNHVYVTAAGDPAVHDLSASGRATLPALAEGEQVLGLAYDFNTDHLFLRLAPAQIIRVIERPSGKVLREMPLPADLQSEKPADLAIRSSDRHLFAVHPDGRAVVELTLFGEPLRRIDLANLGGGIRGIAYDQQDDRLLVLTTTTPARVGAVGADGNVTHSVTLAAAVEPISLGFDSEGRRYYVPLAAGGLGEFGADGTLLKTHDLGSASLTGVDAGQRSFVRVF